MTGQDKPAAPGDDTPAARPVRPAGDQDRPADQHDEAEPAPEEADRGAWQAARELRDHAPGRFAGGLVRGDQYGVAGGRVDGDFVAGDKVTLSMDLGGPGRESGEVLAEDLRRLAGTYCRPTPFGDALTRLTADRLVVLRGAEGTGRRAGALMLLHALGCAPVRALDAVRGAAGLLTGVEPAQGYLACDAPATRSDPLREVQILGLREQLRKQDAVLVITVSESAVLDGVHAVPWSAPEPREALRAHLRAILEPENDAASGTTAPDGSWEALLDEEIVRSYLEVPREIGRIPGWAAELARYHRAEIGLEELAALGEEAVRGRARAWLSAPEEEIELRDKAFLLALAVCDHGPYTTTARLADALFDQLRRVESPEYDHGVKVFSTSLDKRLTLAHARSYQRSEQTDWGPVPQTMVGFREPAAAELLLAEAWTGHPPVRAATERWLTGLALHASPFVRVRAAAGAAVLALADLPAAVHGLLRDWASANDAGLRLQAANALTFAYQRAPGVVRRILEQWSNEPDRHRRWTAIRGYGLLGADFPEEALRVLAAKAAETGGRDRSARRDDGGDGGVARRAAAAEYHSLVAAVQLMLMLGFGPRLITALRRHSADDRVLRELAATSLVFAAEEREAPPDDPASWPLLLRQYAGHAPGSPVRRGLAELWRTALADREVTTPALARLRDWVLVAGLDQRAEAALGDLVAELAVSENDRGRLSYLLRTMPDADGGPPPPVAGRLLHRLAPATPALPADPSPVVSP